MTEQINYKGQNYPVRLSYRVLKNVTTENNNNYFEDLLYHSLKSGCKAENKAMSFERTDMEDILDECFFEFKKLVEFFMLQVKGEQAETAPDNKFEVSAQGVDPKKKENAETLNFHRLAGIALSKFSLTPRQFYELTPLEFESACEDYNKAEERRERFEMEKMRLQTIYLVNCQVQDQFRDVRKMMPFPWDIVHVTIPTELDWERAEAEINKALNRKNK